MGENTWLPLTERWMAAAKSIFLFDVQGSVAKSTFAGLLSLCRDLKGAPEKPEAKESEGELDERFHRSKDS